MLAMNEEFFPSRKLSEPLERILNSKTKSIVNHAEELNTAVQERKPEKALAILRVLLTEVEITEQGLLQGVRFGDSETVSGGKNSAGGQPDYRIKEAEEAPEA